MKRHSREKRWLVPYLDVSNVFFFLVIATLVYLLAVVTEETQKHAIDTTSKLLVHLTWSDGSMNDIDLSLKTPTGSVIWFRAKDVDLAELDHDNLGQSNNTVYDENDAPVSSPSRDEVIYVRQTIVGTYTVNVHFYQQYGGKVEPVKIDLVQVYPAYRAVISRKFTLSEKHEEHTAFRFTVDDKGEVVGTDFVEELFINEMLGKP